MNGYSRLSLRRCNLFAMAVVLSLISVPAPAGQEPSCEQKIAECRQKADAAIAAFQRELTNLQAESGDPHWQGPARTVYLAQLRQIGNQIALEERAKANCSCNPPKIDTGPVPTKPLNLVWDVTDDNGLPLNPQWQYQIDHQQPGVDPENANCTPDGGPNCPFPNVPKLCDVHNDPNLTACTDQQVTVNTQPNTWVNAGCNWPDVASAFTSGLFAGHKNWFPVTVVGPVVLDAGYDDSWNAQQGIGWDADMDFFVRPPHARGLTLSSFLDKGGQIGPEWDGYEVFFNDDTNPNSWWNQLFRNRNTRSDPNNTDKRLVDPLPSVAGPGPRDDSVVIGMLGLDCRHYCHTELHPTYAMAIHTQAIRTDDHWAVFARNFGNEGSCGSLQEEVSITSFSMRLRHPYAIAAKLNSQYFAARTGRYDQGTNVIFPPEVGWNLPLTVVDPATPDAAVILTIALPPPGARAVVLGEVALTWEEVLTHPLVSVTQLRQATTTSRDDEHIENLITRMTPTQRAVFLANAPKPKQATPLRVKAIPQNPNLAPVKVRDFRTIVRSTPDPVREQQMLQFHQAICTAYEGKLPGAPEACRTLSPVPKLSVPLSPATTLSVLISAVPSPLEFTPVSHGPLVVTITNNTQGRVTLGTPSVSGADAADFVIDAGCRGVILSPSGSCKIVVTFRAKGQGQRTAELNVALSNGAHGASVALTGPGLIP